VLQNYDYCRLGDLKPEDLQNIYAWKNCKPRSRFQYLQDLKEAKKLNDPKKSVNGIKYPSHLDDVPYEEEIGFLGLDNFNVDPLHTWLLGNIMIE